jgi:hypothetical protein
VQQPLEGDVPGGAADLGVPGVLGFQQEARELHGVVSRAADLRPPARVGGERRAELAPEPRRELRLGAGGVPAAPAQQRRGLDAHPAGVHPRRWGAARHQRRHERRLPGGEVLTPGHGRSPRASRHP